MLDIRDPYFVRREPYFAAALPSENVGVEHTFGFFLQYFRERFENLLRDKLSKTGLDSLFDASLREMAQGHRDRRQFTKMMDFLYEQVPQEDHQTAIDVITEAYGTLYANRRTRYKSVLEELSTDDRDVLDEEFFDKLIVKVGPVPGHPQQYRVTLTIEFTDESPGGIRHSSTYMMAQGRPVKKHEETKYQGSAECCAVSTSSGGPSNGF